MRRPLSACLIVITTWLLAGPVAAHTEPDLVAVPAGEEAVVTLKPTHGCGDSPTVEVTIRADVAGARAVEVDGWTASETPDGEGRTIVEWTGGTLPADEVGEFPIRFTAPDQAGELLRFPAIQRCADGQELAWIDGDPEGEHPAPRLLILPAGSAPAASIDDVAPDAPGRDQLVAIVDVDNPNVEPTTSTTATPTAPPPTTDDGDEAGAPADDDDSGGLGIAVPVLAGLALLAAAVVAWRRRTP